MNSGPLENNNRGDIQIWTLFGIIRRAPVSPISRAYYGAGQFFTIYRAWSLPGKSRGRRSALPSRVGSSCGSRSDRWAAYSYYFRILWKKGTAKAFSNIPGGQSSKLSLIHLLLASDINYQREIFPSIAAFPTIIKGAGPASSSYYLERFLKE